MQETGEKTAEELYEAGAKAEEAGKYEKALEDYRKSADMGFAKVQHALGYMYDACV